MAVSSISRLRLISPPCRLLQKPRKERLPSIPAITLTNVPHLSFSLPCRSQISLSDRRMWRRRRPSCGGRRRRPTATPTSRSRTSPRAGGTDWRSARSFIETGQFCSEKDMPLFFKSCMKLDINLHGIAHRHMAMKRRATGCVILQLG